MARLRIYFAGRWW